MNSRAKARRIVALEERVAEQATELARLRDELAHLREELAALKHHAAPSMRRTGRCPACGGGRLLHVAKPTEIADSGLAPQAIHHTTGFWGTRLYGPLEHYVCRNCKLIETHVSDLDGLEPDGKQIFALEAPDEPEPEGGPYR